MNPMDMIKIAGMWSAFKQRHPKLPMFFRKAAETGAFRPETVLELTVKTPDGREMAANMKIMAEEKVQRTEKISLSAVFFIQKFDSSFA